MAVARALSTHPALLLADEPTTGNLDSKSSKEILGLIRETTREQGITVVMVTHDASASLIGDRLLRIADGAVVGDERMPATAFGPPVLRDDPLKRPP